MSLFERVNRLTEAQGFTTDVNVGEYAFEVSTVFHRTDKGYSEPEQGTKGMLVGYASYFGPAMGHDESPDEFLDDDDQDEVVERASKIAGVTITWSEGAWQRKGDHWSRALSSAPTKYGDPKKLAAAKKTASGQVCKPGEKMTFGTCRVVKKKGQS